MSAVEHQSGPPEEEGSEVSASTASATPLTQPSLEEMRQRFRSNQIDLLQFLQYQSDHRRARGLPPLSWTEMFLAEIDDQAQETVMREGAEAIYRRYLEEEEKAS